jgi:hypothetical protein
VPLAVELLDSPAQRPTRPDRRGPVAVHARHRLHRQRRLQLPPLRRHRLQPARPRYLRAATRAAECPDAPLITDVTEAWLAGFEDEALGSVTVAVFESAEADVLDWTATHRLGRRHHDHRADRGRRRRPVPRRGRPHLRRVGPVCAAGHADRHRRGDARAVTTWRASSSAVIPTRSPTRSATARSSSMPRVGG